MLLFVSFCDASVLVPKRSSRLSFVTRYLDKLNLNENKTEDLTNDLLLTPTKVPQPFFVKKTPPSSKKKSPVTDEMDKNVTPSKASKSLKDIFESISTTSSEPVPEKDSLELAANVLREKKIKGRARRDC